MGKDHLDTEPQDCVQVGKGRIACVVSDGCGRLVSFKGLNIILAFDCDIGFAGANTSKIHEVSGCIKQAGPHLVLVGKETVEATITADRCRARSVFMSPRR